MSLREFFAMDGYAMFVWPSYILTLVLLVINVFVARSNHRRAVSEARRRLQAQEHDR